MENQQGQARKQISYFSRGMKINEHVRNEGNVMYGARAMNAQLPLFLHRRTTDYDIYSKAPKKSAHKMDKVLDKHSGGDNYYVKPALHPGTYKVIDKGLDNSRGTPDDVGIVDFTKPTRKVKVVKIRGIKYAHLSERVKDARKSIANPEFQFRHEKDRKDIYRIRLGQKLMGW